MVSTEQLISEVIVKDSASNALDRVTASMERTASAEAKVQDGAVGSSRQIETAARSFERLRQSVDPAYASQVRLANVQTQLSRQVALGVATQAEAAGVLTQYRKNMEDAATATTHGHGATATATREFRALFDELSSGRTRQTPGTLAIIANRVLGINGAALLGLGGIIGLVGGFGLLIARAGDLDKEQRQVNIALAATGQSSQYAADQINRYATELAKSSGTSQRDALAATLAVAKMPTIASGAFQQLTKVAGDFAAVTGKTLPDAMTTLADDLAHPAEGARKLDAEFNLFTLGQRVAIEQLVKTGDAAKAQGLIMQALQERFQGLREQGLTPVEKTAGSLSAAWSNMLDNLARTGPIQAAHAALLGLLEFAAIAAKGEASAAGAVYGEAGIGPFQTTLAPPPVNQNGIAIPVPAAAFAQSGNREGSPRRPGAGFAGSGSSADDVAKREAAVNFTKSLDDQARQLEQTARAYGQTEAEALRLRLTNQAEAAGIYDLVKANIEHVVALQRSIDAQKEAEKLRVQGIKDELELQKELADEAAQRKKIDDITAGAQHQIDENKLLIDALKQGNEQYRIEVEYLKLIDQYRKQGVTPSDEQKAAALGQATTLAGQDKQLGDLQNASKISSIARDAAGVLTRGFESAAQSGQTFIGILGNIGTGLAQVIEKALIFAPLETAINQALGGKSGAAGLSYGSIFSGIGGLLGFGGSSPAAPSAAVIGGGAFSGGQFSGGLPGFADGGDPPVGQPFIVGEQGPELMVARSPSTIVPAGFGGGSTNHYYSIDARGSSDPAAVEAAVNRAMNRRIPGIVQASVAATQSSRQRKPSFFGPTG